VACICEKSVSCLFGNVASNKHNSSSVMARTLPQSGNRNGLPWMQGTAHSSLHKVSLDS
jgi:hypothetical protein